MAEQTRPSAIVQDVDTADMCVADATDVELLTAVMMRLTARRADLSRDQGDESREYALAIGHCEDAITRVNKGGYRAKGIFAITDAQRTVQNARDALGLDKS